MGNIGSYMLTQTAFRMYYTLDSSFLIIANAYVFDTIEPLLAKFSDIFGRKPILILSTTLFILASILCGTAQVYIAC